MCLKSRLWVLAPGFSSALLFPSSAVSLPGPPHLPHQPSCFSSSHAFGVLFSPPPAFLFWFSLKQSPRLPLNLQPSCFCFLSVVGSGVQCSTLSHFTWYSGVNLLGTQPGWSLHSEFSDTSGMHITVLLVASQGHTYVQTQQSRLCTPTRLL